MTTAAYHEIRAPRWGNEESEWQTVASKSKYVFGTNSQNALMHRILHLQLRWWTCGPQGEYLIRLQAPRVVAVTICHRWIRIDSHSTNGRICALPKADAVLCGSCHGQARNFPRGQGHKISRELAKVRLGCVEVPI